MLLFQRSLFNLPVFSDHVPLFPMFFSLFFFVFSRVRKRQPCFLSSALPLNTSLSHAQIGFPPPLLNRRHTRPNSIYSEQVSLVQKSDRAHPWPFILLPSPDRTSFFCKMDLFYCGKIIFNLWEWERRKKNGIRAIGGGITFWWVTSLAIYTRYR